MDITTQVSLNNLGIQQVIPTNNTMKTANWLLDYFATHPDTKL